jgi:flagellar hook-basal body complex protein FliE|uniref:Flagellar hook-basal body complex protein FliE n=1 Tax=Desulfobacca acetoxidans TaxID=60893 RepID=A0A7C5AKS2_9BACT
MKVLPTGQGEAGSWSGQSISGPGGPSPDKNLFQNMLSAVQKQQNQADVEVRRALLGEGELHDAILALEKANLGLRLLVQVRNRLVAAYEELSRMQM